MYFVIYAKDRKDGLPIRKANRDAHLEWIRSASGIKVVMAGPLINDAGDTMIGSMLVVNAPDMGAVNAWLTDDPMPKRACRRA